MADNLNITNRSSSTGDAELKRLYAELRERDRRALDEATESGTHCLMEKPGAGSTFVVFGR
jgi:hypothetical protein